MSALTIDIERLESVVTSELALIAKSPPKRDELDSIDLDNRSDLDECLAAMLLPIVNVCNARAVLGGVQRKVGKVGCASCLSHLKPVRVLGEGADGQVWLLESGHAAKIGMIHLHGHDPDERIESVMTEVAAARLAGTSSISPKVHEAWFCTSATQIAYVIIMDAVKGGTSLRRWKAVANSPERVTMLEHVEALIVKMNAMGIFHDDLHESNILVDGKDRPWIIDFSRCTYVDSLSRYKTEHSDILQVREHLADAYVPTDEQVLTQCILVRLQRKGVILAKPGGTGDEVRTPSKTKTKTATK
jgi:predicted Ser/Thr protein kinase